MATHRLWVPLWRPERLNVLLRMHWGARNRSNKQADRLVATYARQQCIPYAAGKRRVGLHDVLRPRARVADGDAEYKQLLDALVECDLLIDDSPKWCETTPPTHERGTASEWGTLITLEDV